MADLKLGTIEHGSEDYKAAIALRYRVLREPLGLQYTQEQLDAESTDIHIIARDADTLVGSLTLTPTAPGEIKMRQVAVHPDHQGKGVGRRLVEFSELTARLLGCTRMTLSARSTAVEFYLKLGYCIVGEPYEEVTLPHQKMEKDIG